MCAVLTSRTNGYSDSICQIKFSHQSAHLYTHTFVRVFLHAPYTGTDYEIVHLSCCQCHELGMKRDRYVLSSLSIINTLAAVVVSAIT